MKKIGRLWLIFMIVSCLAACGQSAQAAWQEQYDLGVRYLSEGNYEEAILSFTAAIEIDPRRPEAFVGRGDAYVRSGETAEHLSAAQEDYKAAIALNEMLPGAWLGLADVYIKQGDWDAARMTLEAGYAATGDAGLGERLDQLDEKASDDGSGNEVLSEDGNSSIRAEGNQLTISLHVPDLQRSYAVNRADTPVNGCDCQWMVRFTDGTRQYEVGTSYWKNEDAPEKMATLHEMQSDVWLFDSDRSSVVIAPAELEIAGTTLRWTFTIPEEYAFDTANMQITGTVIEAG